MKPKVKIKERTIRQKYKRDPKKRAPVGKKTYHDDYRRRQRHEGHLSGEDLDVWIRYWGLEDEAAARLLGTTKRNVRDCRRRNKFLPNKVDNILRGIWFKNPRTFPQEYNPNRVYFLVEVENHWYSDMEAHNWGLNPLDLIFFRFGHGCRVVHRPTGLSAEYREGSIFSHNRRWAMKALSSKVFDLVGVREMDDRIREKVLDAWVYGKRRPGGRIGTLPMKVSQRVRSLRCKRIRGSSPEPSIRVNVVRNFGS